MYLVSYRYNIGLSIEKKIHKNFFKIWLISFIYFNKKIFRLKIWLVLSFFLSTSYYFKRFINIKFTIFCFIICFSGLFWFILFKFFSIYTSCKFILLNYLNILNYYWSRLFKNKHLDINLYNLFIILLFLNIRKSLV